LIDGAKSYAAVTGRGEQRPADAVDADDADAAPASGGMYGSRRAERHQIVRRKDAGQASIP
jgi:hypothetical protein